MIAGLADSEIKEDILSLEEKSLDETVKAIEAKESGKYARQRVGATAASGKVAATKPGPRIVQFPDPITFESYQVHTQCAESTRKRAVLVQSICRPINFEGYYIYINMIGQQLTDSCN